MVGVSVKLALFATLRRKYKVKELTVECNGTVKDLIEKASKVLGPGFINDVYDEDQGKIREDIIFMINGRNIKDLKGEVKVGDKDLVAIFPPIAGG